MMYHKKSEVLHREFLIIPAEHAVKMIYSELQKSSMSKFIRRVLTEGI